MTTILEETVTTPGAPASASPTSALEEKAAAILLNTYKRTPFHPRQGRGAKLVDADGRVYWDLLAGIAVNALGYRHPRLVKALKEEAASLYHVSNLFYHPGQVRLAELLLEGAASSGLSRVFFCNSGTEANEAALKLTRLRTPGRHRVVALEQGFHGRTAGAVSLTGHAPYREPFEPLVPGVVFVEPNDLAALEAAVTPETSAVFLEPILGEAGVLPLTDAFLAKARELCDRAGATLVFDEIQCGLGRTGKLFAFQVSGVLPDLVTLAKPLGGGLPLGAVLVGAPFVDLIKPGMHGTTFGGNPVACRLGVETLSETRDAGLLPKVEALGEWFRGQLLRLKKRCPAIREVRGRGLMWGIELDREVPPVVKALLGKGFVVGTSRQTTLRLLPPLVMPKAGLAAFVKALEEVLKESK